MDANTDLTPAPGALTSEGQMSKSAAMWGTIIAVLGAIGTFGTMGLQALHLTPDSNVGVIAGAIIALAGILKTTLVTVSYNQGRVTLKQAAAVGQTKVAIAALPDPNAAPSGTSGSAGTTSA